MSGRAICWNCGHLHDDHIVSDETCSIGRSFMAWRLGAEPCECGGYVDMPEWARNA